MRAFFLLGLLFIARDCGPGAYHQCAEGFGSVGGSCVRSPDGGAPDLDGSTTPDAGPCGAECPEGRMCNESTGQCVECVTDVQCTDAQEPFCDEGTCAPCADDAHCERFGDTPVCDESRARCVECTGDGSSHCGPFSCRQSDGTCTETLRGMTDVCRPCEADSECATGRRCVRHAVMGTDLGAFCLLDAAMGGCGDTEPSRRPYARRTETESIEGHLSTYCFPPSSTTCQGIRDTRSVGCASSEQCGVTGLDDGYCPTIGSGAGLCSYRCTGAVDCAEGLSCGGSPQHCQP